MSQLIEYSVELVAQNRIKQTLNTYIESYKETDLQKLAKSFYPENTSDYKQFINDNPYFFYENPIVFTNDTKIKLKDMWTAPKSASALIEFTYLDKDNFKLSETYYIDFKKIQGKWYLQQDFYLFNHSIIVDEKYDENNYVSIHDKDILSYTVEENKRVDFGSFMDCKKLIEVTFPKSYKTIDPEWFYHCDNLIRVNIDKASPFMQSVDGIVYSKDLKTLIYYPKGRIQNKNNENGEFFIPEGVNLINRKAFLYLKGLKKVICPSSMKHIGISAFSHSENLEEIVLNDGLLAIMDKAFNECKKLKKITIPNSVTHIGNESFYGAINLTDVEITNKSKLNRLGYGAFEKCKIKSIYLPDTITKIDNWTFQNCYFLENITYSENLYYIGMYAFRNCVALKDFYINNNMKFVDKGAFSFCNELTLRIAYASKPPGWNKLWKEGFNNTCIWSATNESTEKN